MQHIYFPVGTAKEVAEVALSLSAEMQFFLTYRDFFMKECAEAGFFQFIKKSIFENVKLLFTNYLIWKEKKALD